MTTEVLILAGYIIKDTKKEKEKRRKKQRKEGKRDYLQFLVFGNLSPVALYRNENEKRERQIIPVLGWLRRVCPGHLFEKEKDNEIA